MKNLTLNKKILVNRLAEIEADLAELYKFQKLSEKEFKKGYNFAIAEHFLRRALEAVFDIGGHILSRIPLGPGERPEGYKAIAVKLEEFKIVPRSFGKGPLLKMAGFRNRMVHFYQEITKEELYKIICQDLDDLEKFCHHIKKLIEKPDKFDFKVR